MIATVQATIILLFSGPMISERTTRNILIRYAIGIGIVMLGLMAFSALCWWVCTSCAEENPLRSFGFWELVGVAILASIGFFVIRSMRKRRNLTHHNVAPDRAASPRAPYTERLKKTQSNWRALYEQLSRDEREKLKTLMEKYYTGSSDEAGSGERTQWQDEK
jgi:hypothetical protein